MYISQRDNLLAVIRIMGFVMLCLCLLIAYLVHSNKTAHQRAFIDIPAYTLAAKAESLEIDVMQKTTVYDFTQRVFQSLNRWKYDGEDEYEKNIRAHEDVLTPEYMAFLRRDFKRRKGNAVSSELKNRTRLLLPIATGWDEDRVKVLATRNGKPAAWVVLLDMELIEKIKGETIKHLYLRYPIRVSLFTADRTRNPWLLALDGYQDEPQKLSRELDKEHNL